MRHAPSEVLSNLNLFFPDIIYSILGPLLLDKVPGKTVLPILITV